MDRIDRIRQSFSTKKIEQSDTRGYILRHDPDHHKSKHEAADDWDEYENDMADISVESMIIYLEGLKREESQPRDQNDKTINPEMERAISAYSHEQPKAEKRYTYLDADDTEIIDPEHIDTLIMGLQALLDSGIAHITLIPAKGFLESIEKTVEKYSSL